jgi:hypothetical protein
MSSTERELAVKTRYHDHDQITDEVHRVAERRIKHLDHRLADIQEDLKFLDISMRHHQRDDTHTAKLVLWVPSAELAATGEGMRAKTALNDAFDDLLDEVEVYLAKLHGVPAVRREEKFHRDKAEMARAAIDAGQGWPPEPPSEEGEAASFDE